MVNIAMMTPTAGYSAQIRIELRLDGHVVPIAQLGPDFFVVRGPCELSPMEAEIYMRIDDSERSWRVRLVEGVSATRRKTRIVPVAEDRVAGATVG